MENDIALDNLQKRNNSLKSRLVHDQLKYGTYHFGYFKKFLFAIDEYKKHHSFFKVASVVGVSQQELVNWYVQGQLGNPNFRAFYLAIKDIDRGVDEANLDAEEEYLETSQVNEETDQENVSHDGKDYLISQYGDGWSYKTFIDGEKIFIISNELKTLKEKVKAKHLPLD